MQERLQKLIAKAGIASRRHAEELILSGEVTVNGKTITELGTKADPQTEHIKVRGKLINSLLEEKEKVYILLNKPRGYLSAAADDAEGRKLVIDLVKGFGKLHPVGRLDFNSEGMIILTNDGAFTDKITRSKKIPKIYQVKVKGLPPKPAIEKLRRGLRLEDGFKTAPTDITELDSTPKNAWYEVVLREGHNQQIRKMFDAIGHSVVKLKRVSIGQLELGPLKTGESVLLTAFDLRLLQREERAPLPETKKTKEKSARRALKAEANRAMAQQKRGYVDQAREIFGKTERTPRRDFAESKSRISTRRSSEESENRFSQRRGYSENENRFSARRSFSENENRSSMRRRPNFDDAESSNTSRRSSFGTRSGNTFKPKTKSDERRNESSFERPNQTRRAVRRSREENRNDSSFERPRRSFRNDSTNERPRRNFKSKTPSTRPKKSGSRG